MKKLLLFLGCVAALAAPAIMNAAELPEPRVKMGLVPWTPYGYFESFTVSWWKSANVPYTLTPNSEYWTVADEKNIMNSKGIKMVEVLENGSKSLSINQVAMVEFQEDEDTENFENTYLQVTLSALQFPMEPTEYSLLIPAGMFYINVDGEEVPNPEISQTFTVDQYVNPYTVPDPVLDPEEGTVGSIETVQITWPNSETRVLCLLKMFNPEGISVTYDGTPLDGWSIEWGWASKDDENEDQNGNIMYINLGKEYTEAGVYEINIDENIMWIADLDGGGTMDNPAYTFTYTVDPSLGVGTLKADDAKGPVYNLNGIKVAESLDNLAPGLYIHNGQKIVIK